MWEIKYKEKERVTGAKHKQVEIKQLLYAWNLVVGELTNSYSHLLNLFFFEFDILINELDLDILIVTSLHASTFDNNSIEFSQRQKKWQQ